MKTVMIVNAVVNQEHQESLIHYQQNAGPLFIQAGGKPLGKFKVSERIAGTTNLNLTVVMEFDNSDAIKGVFESEAYKELIPYRNNGFKTIDIFIGA